MRPKCPSMLPWGPLAPQPSIYDCAHHCGPHATQHTPSESSLSMPNPVHTTLVDIFLKSVEEEIEMNRQFFVVITFIGPALQGFRMSSVSVWCGSHTLNLFSCAQLPLRLQLLCRSRLQGLPAATSGKMNSDREKVSKDKRRMPWKMEHVKGRCVRAERQTKSEP